MARHHRAAVSWPPRRATVMLFVLLALLAVEQRRRGGGRAEEVLLVPSCTAEETTANKNANRVGLGYHRRVEVLTAGRDGANAANIPNAGGNRRRRILLVPSGGKNNEYNGPPLGHDGNGHHHRRKRRTFDMTAWAELSNDRPDRHFFNNDVGQRNSSSNDGLFVHPSSPSSDDPTSRPSDTPRPTPSPFQPIPGLDLGPSTTSFAFRQPTIDGADGAQAQAQAGQASAAEAQANHKQSAAKVEASKSITVTENEPDLPTVAVFYHDPTKMDSTTSSASTSSPTASPTTPVPIAEPTPEPTNPTTPGPTTSNPTTESPTTPEPTTFHPTTASPVTPGPIELAAFDVSAGAAVATMANEDGDDAEEAGAQAEAGMMEAKSKAKVKAEEADGQHSPQLSGTLVVESTTDSPRPLEFALEFSPTSSDALDNRKDMHRVESVVSDFVGGRVLFPWQRLGEGADAAAAEERQVLTVVVAGEPEHVQLGRAADAADTTDGTILSPSSSRPHPPPHRYLRGRWEGWRWRSAARSPRRDPGMLPPPPQGGGDGGRRHFRRTEEEVGATRVAFRGEEDQYPPDVVDALFDLMVTEEARGTLLSLIKDKSIVGLEEVTRLEFIPPPPPLEEGALARGETPTVMSTGDNSAPARARGAPHGEEDRGKSSGPAIGIAVATTFLLAIGIFVYQRERPRASKSKFDVKEGRRLRRGQDDQEVHQDQFFPGDGDGAPRKSLSSRFLMGLHRGSRGAPAAGSDDGSDNGMDGSSTQGSDAAVDVDGATQTHGNGDDVNRAMNPFTRQTRRTRRRKKKVRKKNGPMMMAGGRQSSSRFPTSKSHRSPPRGIMAQRRGMGDDDEGSEQSSSSCSSSGSPIRPLETIREGAGEDGSVSCCSASAASAATTEDEGGAGCCDQQQQHDKCSSDGGPQAQQPPLRPRLLLANLLPTMFRDDPEDSSSSSVSEDEDDSSRLRAVGREDPKVTATAAAAMPKIAEGNHDDGGEREAPIHGTCGNSGGSSQVVTTIYDDPAKAVDDDADDANASHHGAVVDADQGRIKEGPQDAAAEATAGLRSGNQEPANKSSSSSEKCPSSSLPAKSTLSTPPSREISIVAATSGGENLLSGKSVEESSENVVPDAVDAASENSVASRDERLSDEDKDDDDPEEEEAPRQHPRKEYRAEGFLRNMMSIVNCATVNLGGGSSSLEGSSSKKLQHSQQQATKYTTSMGAEEGIAASSDSYDDDASSSSNTPRSRHLLSLCDHQSGPADTADSTPALNDSTSDSARWDTGTCNMQETDDEDSTVDSELVVGSVD